MSAKSKSTTKRHAPAPRPQAAAKQAYSREREAERILNMMRQREAVLLYDGGTIESRVVASGNVQVPVTFAAAAELVKGGKLVRAGRYYGFPRSDEPAKPKGKGPRRAA